MQTFTTLNLAILATSDLHGHLYPTDYRGDGERDYGLSKLSPLIARERARSDASLLIDNGDLLQGTPLMYHRAKFGKRGDPHPAIRAHNFLRYDAAVIGNHEFNYGPDVLRDAIAQSEFPWLSANIVDAATGEPAFGPAYAIKRIEGVTVAILGLTTPYIPNWEQPVHIAGLSFLDAVDTAKRWIPRIRELERPDVMIVSYHGGFERDLRTGEPTEPLSGENQGYALCAEVPGIDVLITGHQHRLLEGEINGVTIVQPGSNGQALGKASVTLERAEERWVVREKRAELIYPEAGGEKDEDLLALIAEEERRTQAWLDQPIGRAEGDLTIRDPLGARMADHPFVEFVNRVQLDTTGAGISCTALFTDESRGFAERITMRDIVSNYVYPNTLKVLLVSGQDIRDALEHAAAYFEVEADGGLSVSAAFREPKPQHYNYDMWEGIEYELDLAKPVGARVVKLEKEGTPLDPDASHEVAMNSYRASGGGHYDMFRGKPVVREITVDMTEIIADYILERGTIRATCDHNWRAFLSAPLR